MRVVLSSPAFMVEGEVVEWDPDECFVRFVADPDYRFGYDPEVVTVAAVGD